MRIDKLETRSYVDLDSLVLRHTMFSCFFRPVNLWSLELDLVYMKSAIHRALCFVMIFSVCGAMRAGLGKKYVLRFEMC